MSRRFVTMVQIIAGIKGKGKTKRLLDMANAAGPTFPRAR